MQIDWGLFHRLVSRTILMGLIMIFTICQGCAKAGNVFLGLGPKASYGEDLTLLEKGFVVYENGDTAGATAIFQKVYDNTGDLNIRNRALYGLSISLLLGAKTPEEFNHARSLWKKWRQSRRKNDDCEDPGYLEPFLMCKFPLPEHNANDAQLTNDAALKKASNDQHQQVQQRTRDLKANLKNLEKKYNALRAEKESLVRLQIDKDATIKALKEKIKALEDIDQKIQEKKNKTEISSPE